MTNAESKAEAQAAENAKWDAFEAAWKDMLATLAWADDAARRAGEAAATAIEAVVAAKQKFPRMTGVQIPPFFMGEHATAAIHRAFRGAVQRCPGVPLADQARADTPVIRAAREAAMGQPSSI